MAAEEQKTVKTAALMSGCFFSREVSGQAGHGYTETGERSVTDMGGRGSCRILGICAVALGAGILIAAIFPVGALLFLVAFLLIACGCACCRY